MGLSLKHCYVIGCTSGPDCFWVLKHGCEGPMFGSGQGGWQFPGQALGNWHVRQPDGSIMLHPNGFEQAWFRGAWLSGSWGGVQLLELLNVLSPVSFGG